VSSASVEFCIMSKFLRESQSGIERVDTQAGIIYGVKVLGPRSRNGRVYEDAAIRKALPLYEGVTVNINHVRNDPTTRAYQERQMQDRWGVLRNVRYVEGSIYADLHYIKSHPMTKQLVEAAQRFPEIFGLSHDAGGDEQIIDGERRVVEMYEVKSVDVVADPATNEGLFESYLPVDPAFARAARRKARLSLFETRDGDGDGKINDGKPNEAPAPPKETKTPEKNENPHAGKKTGDVVLSSKYGNVEVVVSGDKIRYLGRRKNGENVGTFDKINSAKDELRRPRNPDAFPSGYRSPDVEWKEPKVKAKKVNESQSDMEIRMNRRNARMAEMEVKSDILDPVAMRMQQKAKRMKAMSERCNQK
jgi:hypothetical protein